MLRKLLGNVENFVIIGVIRKEVRKMFDVWNNVLAEIERKIPPTHFNTWFVGTSLVEIEDGVVIIGAKNAFIVHQLETKFNETIKSALKNNGVEFQEVKYIQQDTSSKVKKAGREVVDSGTKERERVMRVPLKSGIARSAISTGLNSKYTLDNFVVGSNNDLAVSVARAVVEHPGEKYNPFFLYGGPGLGKTHLVQAVGNELLHKNPNMKVLYIPINHFYTEFVDAIQKKSMDAFRKKFQKLDLLIVDDFQFIVGKEKSQEEFFNLFNDMHQANKQIIITSDRLPDQIKTVDERLASRLTWAGAFDLQLPSFEDRCAILKSKAEFMGAEIEDAAVEYIAENVKSNIRDLEKEFQQILAMAELKGVTPLSLINSGYVQASSSSQNKTVTPGKVVEEVAKYYNLSVKEMCGGSRVANIKNARQVAMYLLTNELQLSQNETAAAVGLKDHSTVSHGVKRIAADLKLNFSLREQISGIREKIYA